MTKRCEWATSDSLYIRYHDQEWGVPVYDDHLIFEFLILEGAQAGLSWLTILKKRENYRAAFDHFKPQLVAQYETQKIEQLLLNPGIVRNRRKVESAVTNARAFLEVQRRIWQLCRIYLAVCRGKANHQHLANNRRDSGSDR
jgi:DNA-3-methyladenine glycosylase I